MEKCLFHTFSMKGYPDGLKPCKLCNESTPDKYCFSCSNKYHKCSICGESTMLNRDNIKTQFQKFIQMWITIENDVLKLFDNGEFTCHEDIIRACRHLLRKA